MLSEPQTFIPLSVPEISGNEWKYVKECLDTGWVSSVGTYVKEFERMFAELMPGCHAVACVNGTAALHTALIIAGVQDGDEVICSDVTFIAPVNAIRYCNAVPVLIDCDMDSWQLDTKIVERFLREDCERREGGVFNKKSGRRIAAIVPVHILGQPADMDPLLKLSKEFNIPIVEDSTESLGASYNGVPTGTIGELGCFSFNGNKLISTGGGGMIVTKSQDHADRARYLTQQAKDDELEFIHNEVGYNYRLTNVAAAIGVAQLERLEEFLTIKRRIADRYAESLGDIPGVKLMPEIAGTVSALWLYTIRLVGQSSRPLLRHLHQCGIQTRPLWQPIHLSPAYAGYDFMPCPNAEVLQTECLSLPCSVGLRPEDQERVIQEVRRFLCA